MLLILLLLLPCKLISLQFWEDSIHDGTRIETLTNLRYLNQTLVIAGKKKKYSKYPEYFNDKGLIYPDDRGFESRQEIGPTDNFNFFNYWKDKDLMIQTDAFICTFYISYCEAFLPFNKSIIYLAAHRYAIHECSQKDREKFDNILIQTAGGKRPGKPYVFLGAMNEYDVHYINYYTGLSPILLEATALLYGALNTIYKPIREEIIIGPSQGSHCKSALDQLYPMAAQNNVKLGTLKSLYGTFKMQHYADHRAVVLLPYAVHSYGISEVYANSIPMFVPSIDFMIELNCMDDWKLNCVHYCPGGYNPPKHLNSTHEFDPESQDKESQRYWLKFADFYRWPFITYFSSFEELFLKLKTVDTNEIHRNMVIENEKRLEKAHSTYKNIFQNIQPNRLIPKDYNLALQEIWNLSATHRL